MNLNYNKEQTKPWKLCQKKNNTSQKAHMYQMSLRSFTAVGTKARLNYLYKMTFYLRSESFPDVEQTKS